MNINFSLAIILYLLLIFTKNLKIYFPKWLIFLVIFYIPFLIFGALTNLDFHIDFKFHLFSLIFLVLLGSIIKKVGLTKTVNIVYSINVLIFILYLLIFAFNVPKDINLFSRGTEAAGYGYRVAGPSLVTFLIIPIYYLFKKHPWDKKLTFMFFTALISIFLNGSLQYMILMFLTYSLVLIKKSKYLIVYPLTFYLVLKISVFIVTPFMNDSYKTKLSYINKPWEYPTVQHRVETVEIMLEQTTNSFTEILFGSGVGIKSTYFEKNEISPTLSRERTFLEIDNGFFYVYHRAGIVGLLAFLFFHFYILFFKSHPFNFRLAVFIIFVITNLLSIHYFTTATYSLLILIPFFKFKEHE